MAEIIQFPKPLHGWPIYHAGSKFIPFIEFETARQKRAVEDRKNLEAGRYVAERFLELME